MTPWKDRPILILDTETTGIDPETARIWEIATLQARLGSRPSDAGTIVNPGVEIPAEVIKLCGLTPMDLAEVVAARPFADIAPALQCGFEQQVVAGYNLLAYDWPLLTAEFAGCGQVPPRPQALLDALVMIRRLRSLRFRALGDAFRALCPDADMGTAHRAAGDCRMTWGVLQALMPELPDDLDELVELQAQWKAERDADFARYGYWLSTDPQSGELVLACGKHCGQRLGQVDPGYLAWALVKSPTWDAPLPAATAEAFRSEIRRRSS